jgi:hypothetical protein
VTTGTKTEREITLEAELEAEKGSHNRTAKEKKDRELRIAELEDELHRLKGLRAGQDTKKRHILDLTDFFEE